MSGKLISLFFCDSVRTSIGFLESSRGILPGRPDLFAKLTNQIEFTRLYDELGTYGAVWKPLNTIHSIVIPGNGKIDLTVTPEVEKYEIFADPLIEKVFYNLFDNSVRHGGSVTNIRVSAKVSDTSLQIYVQDNGIGISDTDKPQIFKRGYGKNTGLGLFLVREILSITGITIDENGHAGTGACFVLTVPADHFRTILSG